MRLDALAGAVRQIVEDLDYDQMRVVMQRQIKQGQRWHQIMSDPSQMVDYMTALSLGVSGEAALAVQSIGQRIGNKFGKSSRAGRRKW